MECYDSPYETELKFTVDCNKIVDIYPKEFDVPPLKLVGYEIVIDSGNKLFWAFGDDSMNIKGLWNRTLKKHMM